MTSTNVKRDRDAVVADLRQTEQTLRAGARLLTGSQRRVLFDRIDELTQKYYDLLPFVPIARNPFSGEMVSKRMDVFGLDGPWWNANSWDDHPRAGEHYFAYQGALVLGNHDVSDAALDNGASIRPGPEVPFVIPRLLTLPGAICVISSLQILVPACTAYFMTYFANPTPPGSARHQPWLRETYWYIDETGYERWDSKTDPWDFDLERWRRESPSKLAWIEPGSESMRLVSWSASSCPYEGLPGRREPAIIRKGQLGTLPLPQGEALDPQD